MLIEEPGYGAHHLNVLRIIEGAIDKGISLGPMAYKLYKGQLSDDEETRLIDREVELGFHQLKKQRDFDSSQALRDAEHYLFTLDGYSDDAYSQSWLTIKSRIYSEIKRTTAGRHFAGWAFGESSSENNFSKPASKLGQYEHYYNVAGSKDKFDIKKYVRKKLLEAGEKWELKIQERERKDKLYQQNQNLKDPNKKSGPNENKSSLRKPLA